MVVMASRSAARPNGCGEWIRSRSARRSAVGTAKLRSRPSSVGAGNGCVLEDVNLRSDAQSSLGIIGPPAWEDASLLKVLNRMDACNPRRLTTGAMSGLTGRAWRQRLRMLLRSTASAVFRCCRSAVDHLRKPSALSPPERITSKKQSWTSSSNVARCARCALGLG